VRLLLVRRLRSLQWGSIVRQWCDSPHHLERGDLPHGSGSWVERWWCRSGIENSERDSGCCSFTTGPADT
jgi:hypothetical protein